MTQETTEPPSQSEPSQSEETQAPAPSSAPPAASDNDSDWEDLPPLIDNQNNDISDSDDDDDDDDDETASSGQREIILLKAQQAKEEGNQHFANKELDQAARSYRRGTSTLKKLSKFNESDPQVKTLLLALHNNLAMVLFKQNKIRSSRDVASKALQIENSNVKALYRRALAHRKLGDLEQARIDLRSAVQSEPANAACKRELVAVKKELDATKASQKKALAKAFDGGGLYDDKEATRKLKEEQQAAKKKRQQEEYAQRKQQWEDECVSRMARNEPAVSFEDWDKERQQKLEAEGKAAAEAKRAADQRRKEEQTRNRASSRSSSIVEDDSDDELTEKELASLRGYKKTKDGRVTSYFTRELSDQEKQQLEPQGPRRLDATPQPLPAPQPFSARSSSKWNAAGTWEERDTTQWCTKTLREYLEQTACPNGEITEVTELTGDASMAVVGGKKRYIFDFHACFKYQILDVDGQTVASGIGRLPDFCSTSHDEPELQYDVWTTHPADEAEALEARNTLSKDIRLSLQQFVSKFNAEY